MTFKKHLVGLLFIFGIIIQSNATQIEIHLSNESEMTTIALEKLALEISFTKHLLVKKSFLQNENFKILLFDIEKDADLLNKKRIEIASLSTEGYQIIKDNNIIHLIGGDNKGLMYGILDLKEQLKLDNNFLQLNEKIENPKFEFRAIKFNLPWSSYRLGESLQLHMKTVKDIRFWEDFLDMMVENRFNALTLWNLHPFTFMIQPENYPEATQFTGQQFKDWQTFWRTLFKMAKDRGIETYILNWNIITSPGMTAAHNVANYKDDLEWHYGFTPADTSPIIVDYMRDCITQVINEYPNLTGVGVSVGERMKMPINEAMQWIKDTYVEGIKRADRKAKFIHRAPFSISPKEAREYIESYKDFDEPIIMEFKFNWSHGHSSPNLSITHGGKINDQYWNPKPTNYKMAWMMRNEDFIMLNWGNTDFIKEHIAVNGGDHVMGYFVGSETYIPAKEYRMKSDVKYNWKYAFEKQWEFYKMWGHLLYNPELPDSYFADQFDYKYGFKEGDKMLKALKLGSEMPLKLASFYQGTWDFTLYCEGFLNGKQLYRNYEESNEAFIKVDEMITHKTLDARYLNIDEFTNRRLKNITIKKDEITPQSLSEQMNQNGLEILKLCNELSPLPTKDKVNFNIELNDIKTWGYLSLYFAEKLKGGIYLDEAIKTKNKELQTKSIEHLKKAAEHWKSIIETTELQYQEVSLLHIKTVKFSWRFFYPEVLKDIEIAKNKF